MDIGLFWYWIGGKFMKWIEIKSNEDIQKINKQYNNFEDSYLINFSFESGNYVDSERIGYENNNNILILKFERIDNNPFSIELMFERTRRLNCFFPIEGKDNWTSGIQYAKIAKNEEFYYWTVWEEFNPYDNEHLKYNDFILVEAKNVRWRIIE